MTEYSNQNIGWDDALPDIPQEEFTLLAPGQYEFVVTNMERKEMTTPKLGTVRVAEVQLRFSDGQLEGTGKVNLMLHPKTLWKVREFFASIGDAVEKGRPFVPKWNNVIGRSGKCLVKNGAFTGRNGEKYQTNEVDKFLEPDEEEPAF